MNFKTREYKISRLQLAYIAAEEYVRSFWWYVAIVPVGGLIAAIFGRGPLQIVGLGAIIWPISIPARALFTTSKASRLLAKGTWLGTNDDEILFYGVDKLGLKVSFHSIKDSVIRQRHVLIRTRRLGFLPVPVSAFFAEADVEAFRTWLAMKVDESYDEE